MHTYPLLLQLLLAQWKWYSLRQVQQCFAPFAFMTHY